jgi:hypothetical protein
MVKPYFIELLEDIGNAASKAIPLREKCVCGDQDSMLGIVFGD